MSHNSREAEDPSLPDGIRSVVGQKERDNPLSHITQQGDHGAAFADAKDIVKSRIAGPHLADVDPRPCHG